MCDLVVWRGTLEAVGVAGYFESFFDWLPYEGEPEPILTLTADEASAVRAVHALMAEAIKGSENTNEELVASGWPQ